MKIKLIPLIIVSAFAICGCGGNPPSGKDVSSEEASSEASSVSSSQSSTASSSSSRSSSSHSSSTQTKVKVAAHTLSDSNPPIDVLDPGEQVSESTWNSFLNGNASKLASHYNFTYTAFHSANNYQMQFFTKNGYAYKALQGGTYSRIYYERKSGSTFYNYVDVPDGFLRQETSFDLTGTFTDRFLDEIDRHMFAFSNYVWNEYGERYVYDGGTFSSSVQFQGGYLSSLVYVVDGQMFRIDSMFGTTIDIPESYYYQ